MAKVHRSPLPKPPRAWDELHLSMAIVVVALLVAYGPALRGLPLWDDAIALDDRALRTASSPWAWWSSLSHADYWPVTYTVFWAMMRLFGDAPLPYHVLGLAIHAVNAGLLGLTLRRLGTVAWPALLLFALHPVHVETVAYIFQVKTSLATTFYLAALLAWLRHHHGAHHGRGWLVMSWVALALALLTKTSTAMWPAVPVLILVLRRQVRVRALVELLPHVALCAVLVGITMHVNAREHAQVVVWDAGWLERTLTAARNAWFYLGKLLLPVGITPVYARVVMEPSVWTSWLPAAGWLAVGVGLARLRRHRAATVAAVGLGFFLVNLAPALGFANIYYMRFSLVADHWQYLGSLGLLALASPAYTWMRDRLVTLRTASRVAALAGAAILVSHAGLTRHHASAYQGPETFWRRALEANPASALSHNNLGVEDLRAGRGEDATRRFQDALRLDPGYDEALYNLGYMLERVGQSREAESNLRAAVAANSRHFKAHNSLGSVLMGRGALAEAEDHLRRALEIRPSYVDGLSNLGLLLNQTGRRQEGLAHIDRAISQRPSSADLHVNRGAVLQDLRRDAEAETALLRALALQPRHAYAHFNLGALYARQPNRLGDAARHLKAGLEVQPGHAQATRMLADVESRLATP
jgi:tetratricopeptide (TPR) repeat protein